MKIRIDCFEGPLDLLLFLIQKNELDISSISLHKITDQYVQYIELMRELNFDVASEFLVMAATLIYLKSNRLLPTDPTISNTGEQPMNEEEILRRLREYKRFQEMGNELLKRPLLNQDVFTRPNIPPPEKQVMWRELDMSSLTLVFQDALKRSRQRTRVILKEATSIPERILELSKVLEVGKLTEFPQILSKNPERSEIIVTFLALLELTRLRKIKIYQNTLFGSIFLTLTDSLSTLDPTLVTGFQYNIKKIEELAIHGT